MTNIKVLEPLTPLVEQATIDLAECLDCSWALALRWLDSAVVPLCTVGRNPQMDKCIACAKTMVHSQAGNTLVAPKCLDAEEWAPRVIRPIVWNNEIVAVLIFGRKR